MADPVAEKSGFLKMYMSSHPDTLVAYAKWFGKVKETIASAEMSAIDTKSMTLTCKLKDGATKVVVVPIVPPMKGYEDVKPRLLEMKAFAQEGLGMIKVPQITFFEFPRDARISAFFVTLNIFVYYFQNTPSIYGQLADFIISWTGTGIVTFGFWFLTVTHILESLYMYSLCRKHTSFGIGALYVASTLVSGFPTWAKLRKNIQAARIDSVMKIQ